MTDPKGNSEFCFPETLSQPRSQEREDGKDRTLGTRLPRGEAEGNIEVEVAVNKK